MKWILPFALVAAPAFAETCPPATDHSAQIARILTDIQAAETEGEGRAIGQQLWPLWLDAPDERAQTLLDQGMARRGVYDLLGALEVFDLLVEYCPDYAEGYNQRAFASYLAQDFAAALVDLDIVLEMMPNHTAAMSGKALTLMGLGRTDEAQEVLRAAVALHPWLQERALLIEPIGTDL